MCILLTRVLTFADKTLENDEERFEIALLTDIADQNELVDSLDGSLKSK